LGRSRERERGQEREVREVKRERSERSRERGQRGQEREGDTDLFHSDDETSSEDVDHHFEQVSSSLVNDHGKDGVNHSHSSLAKD
jgi:hypothetical protein